MGQGHGSGVTTRRSSVERAGTALVVATLLVATAAAAERDFRGMRTGMTLAEAAAAARANGLRCEAGFTGRTTCRGGDASVVLVTTGRGPDLVWELQVSLVGRYDPAEMIRRLTSTYALVPTPTPQVFATAAGDELFLLETGGSATVFYLRSPAVLRGDPPALPPPKL